MLCNKKFNWMPHPGRVTLQPRTVSAAITTVWWFRHPCLLSEETRMKILGHNYTGGTRRGESGVYLHSYDATSGERLPYDFVQASLAEVDAAASTVGCS